MDHVHLARRAIEGDKLAFVELTRRFQLFAFGSALGHVGDFQKARTSFRKLLLLRGWRSRPLPNLLPFRAGSEVSSGIKRFGCFGETMPMRSR
jgi:hypothetical protein